MSRMSRVSKYYRKICEPLLYEDVTFWQTDGDRIKFLLMAILTRTELRLLIKRFSLCQGDRGTPERSAIEMFRSSIEKSNVVCERMWSHTLAIRGAVEDLASSLQLDYEYRTHCFSEAFKSFPHLMVPSRYFSACYRSSSGYRSSFLTTNRCPSRESSSFRNQPKLFSLRGHSTNLNTFACTALESCLQTYMSRYSLSLRMSTSRVSASFSPFHRDKA
jgi:hypothetical protein